MGDTTWVGGVLQARLMSSACGKITGAMNNSKHHRDLITRSAMKIGVSSSSHRDHDRRPRAEVLASIRSCPADRDSEGFDRAVGNRTRSRS